MWPIGPRTQPSSASSCCSVSAGMRGAKRVERCRPMGISLPLDRQARARGGRAHHLDGLRHDLVADIVAVQNADFDMF